MLFLAWNKHNEIWHLGCDRSPSTVIKLLMVLSNNIRYDIIFCPRFINHYDIVLTLRILTNMTFKPISNAICSWFEFRTNLQIISHSRIQIPIVFRAIIAYNGNLNSCQMWSQLPKSSFATTAHTFLTSIDLQVSR